MNAQDRNNDRLRDDLASMIGGKLLSYQAVNLRGQKAIRLQLARSEKTSDENWEIKKRIANLFYLSTDEVHFRQEGSFFKVEISFNYRTE